MGKLAAGFVGSRTLVSAGMGDLMFGARTGSRRVVERYLLRIRNKVDVSVVKPVAREAPEAYTSIAASVSVAAIAATANQTESREDDRLHH